MLTGRREAKSKAKVRPCSNNRTDAEALMKAVSMITLNRAVVSNIPLVTDALSVIEALTNNKATQLAKAM